MKRKAIGDCNNSNPKRVHRPLIRVVSLFSGAGGFDLGFVQAGFQVVWASDINPDACSTYARNIGNHIVNSDIALVDDSGIPECDVVIGGPPCQGFSVAGKMNADDPRNGLIWEFVRIVAAKKPKIFVMENVAALANLQRWEDTRTKLTSRLTDLGYNVNTILLNARDYGVPQSRERAFFVGTAEGIEQISSIEKSAKAVTAGDALRELPPPGTYPNEGQCTAKITICKKPVLRKTPFAGMLFNGAGRPIDLTNVANTLPASMGGNATPIVDEDALRSGKEQWVYSLHKALIDGRTIDVPSCMRRVTVSEAAVLQAFPVDFQFLGSQSSKFRQIGNAVPPALAKAIAEAIKKVLP